MIEIFEVYYKIRGMFEVYWKEKQLIDFKERKLVLFFEPINQLYLLQND